MAGDSFEAILKIYLGSIISNRRPDGFPPPQSSYDDWGCAEIRSGLKLIVAGIGHQPPGSSARLRSRRRLGGEVPNPGSIKPASPELLTDLISHPPWPSRPGF